MNEEDVIKKLKPIFKRIFSKNDFTLSRKLSADDVEEWDSIGHMTLMSGLEDAFKIALETDDIIDFSSYEKGKEILKKYKVNF